MEISRQNILKKLNEGNPCWKYMKTGDKCNSVIRTIGEDQAWQDIDTKSAA